MSTGEISDEIIERFKGVGTATVYSAVNQRGYPLCYMKGVNCYTPGMRVVGRARTLQYVPFRPDIEEERNRGEDAPEYRAMGSCGSGDVLVVGTNRSAELAIAGDVILLHLKMVGAEGVITDGAVRDLPQVKEYGYGIFTAGVTPAGRAGMITYDDNIDVVCGGITVRPGDVIVAEDHDIVCVPQQIAEEVIDWAEEHEELEEVVKGMILKDGCPPGRYYNAATFERLEKERRG